MKTTIANIAAAALGCVGTSISAATKLLGPAIDDPDALDEYMPAWSEQPEQAATTADPLPLGQRIDA